MWNERRMTSGPGQTKAGAASCRLDAIGEDRPLSLSAQQLRTPAGAQAADVIEPLRGITSIPARMFIRHPNVRKSPDQERRAVDEQRPNEPKPVAPRPTRAEHDRVADRRGAFLATTAPRSGLRPRMGGGTPRAIARIEVRAIGSAMWLVRCCCRRGPHRFPAPALDRSRHQPRELVPESSLPVRPSNVAGG